MHKILVVEDDTTIRECIVDFLKQHDYLVDSAKDGAEALTLLRKTKPDLLVLDLTIPKITGETVCQEARNTYPELPIIILTAKNQPRDVLNGFQLGADDYVAKPFEFDELMARIKAKLRNSEQPMLKVDDLVLDSVSVSVSRNGKTIQLSPHEFKLLQYLMSNKGKVLSREMILNRVWEYSYDVDSRVVDVYVGYLRKKIDADAPKKLINSVRGFGYVIKE
jgi:two-component system OmpR family response regulator